MPIRFLAQKTFVIFKKDGQIKTFSWGGQLVPKCELYIYIKRRTNHRNKTQANKRSPLLSEEVPYQITLIRLRQGSLDRRRREKVIWKMFTENVVRESSKPCKLKKMQ